MINMYQLTKETFKYITSIIIIVGSFGYVRVFNKPIFKLCLQLTLNIAHYLQSLSGNLSLYPMISAFFSPKLRTTTLSHIRR